MPARGQLVLHTGCGCRWEGQIAVYLGASVLASSCYEVRHASGETGGIFAGKTRVVSEEEAAVWLLTNARPLPREEK